MEICLGLKDLSLLQYYKTYKRLHEDQIRWYFLYFYHTQGTSKPDPCLMGFLNLVILALTRCKSNFPRNFPNPYQFQKKCLFISELFRSNLDKRLFCISVCPNKHPLLKHPLLVVFTDLYTHHASLFKMNELATIL